MATNQRQLIRQNNWKKNRKSIFKLLNNNDKEYDCKKCGKSFIPTNWQLAVYDFECRTCRNNRYSIKHPKLKKRCPICDTEFISNKRTFCSLKCQRRDRCNRAIEENKKIGPKKSVKKCPWCSKDITIVGRWAFRKKTPMHDDCAKRFRYLAKLTGLKQPTVEQAKLKDGTIKLKNKLYEIKRQLPELYREAGYNCRRIS